MSRKAYFHKNPLREQAKECDKEECEEKHYSIDVLGKDGTAVFDCEHKSHTFVFKALTPVDPKQSGLDLTACTHNADDCASCSHQHDGNCFGEVQVLNCHDNKHGDDDHDPQCLEKKVRKICGSEPHKEKGRCAKMKHSGDPIPA